MMNDLIKQFAIDCAGQLEWDSPKDPASYTFTPDEMTRFAELIVRQCMAQCVKVEDDEELSNYEGGFKDGALLCYQEIKEHFGIEE